MGMREPTSPSKEDLESFQRFVIAFESEGFVAGTWVKQKDTCPGFTPLSHWVGGPIVEEWHAAI